MRKKTGTLCFLLLLWVLFACNNTDNTPEAYFSVSPKNGKTGQILTFNAEGSIHAQRYSWDWDDDGIWDSPDNTNPVKIHIYDKAGHYRVTLKVENEDGETAYINKDIEILLDSRPIPQKKYYTIALANETQWYKMETEIPGARILNSGSGTVFNMTNEMGIQVGIPVNEQLIQNLSGKKLPFDTSSSESAFINMELNGEVFHSAYADNQTGSELHIQSVHVTDSFMGYPSFLLEGTYSCKLANNTKTKAIELKQGIFALRMVNNNK